MLNDKAQVRLRGRNFDFSVPLGEGPATIAGGGAEYEEGRRPKADAVTLFTGNALLRIEVPVLLDKWQTAHQHPEQKVDVWDEVQQILNLCSGFDRADPPDFVAEGPIPYSGHRWVMELPEWGAGLRHRDGRLLRQALTLRLLQFNDATTIKVRKGPKGPLEVGPAVGDGAAAGSATKLKKAESLLEIGARVYGDPGYAYALGRVNNIRDVRRKIPAGEVVLLPSKGELDVTKGELGAIGPAREA